MKHPSEQAAKNEQLLDQLLGEAPEDLLPEDFADRLVKKIEIRQSVKQNLIDYFTILGAIAGIIASLGITYYFLNKERFFELLPLAFNEYTLLIAFIALFVYFMDKVMLRLLNQLK